MPYVDDWREDARWRPSGFPMGVGHFVSDRGKADYEKCRTCGEEHERPRRPIGFRPRERSRRR